MRSATRRIEAVANAPDRLNGLAPERQVDLASQVADVDLDDVGLAVEGEVPHFLERLALRQCFAGPAQQELQQRELTRGEGDFDSSSPAAVPGCVQHQVAHGQDRWMLARPPP